MNGNYKNKTDYTHELIILLRNEAKSDIDNLLKYILYMKENKNLNRVEYLGLTVDEIRCLNKFLNESDKRKLKHTYIYLYCSKPTQILFDEYKDLLSSFNIYSVVVNGLTNTYTTDQDEFAKIIDSKMWYEYLKNLNSLTKKISQYTSENDPDKEKKIFCILCSRIIESITYDLNPNSSYEFNKNRKYHSENAPDEIVGLVGRTCVCRGYAGIVRDSCAIFNIESLVIKGNNDEAAHAWNQVKLDGKWYNVDLTWDRKAILENNDFYWMLKGTNEFNKYGFNINGKFVGHASYSLNRSSIEKFCSESISNDFIKKYLYFEKNKKESWLKLISKKINNFNMRGIRK